jgi:hypothetical protein
MVEFAAFLFIVLALGWIFYKTVRLVVASRALRAIDPRTWDWNATATAGSLPPLWLCDRCSNVNRTPSGEGDGRGDLECVRCGRQLTAISYEAGGRIRESAAPSDPRGRKGAPDKGICRVCKIHFFHCRCPDGPDLPKS